MVWTTLMDSVSGTFVVTTLTSTYLINLDLHALVTILGADPVTAAGLDREELHERGDERELGAAALLADLVAGLAVVLVQVATGGAPLDLVEVDAGSVVLGRQEHPVDFVSLRDHVSGSQRQRRLGAHREKLLFRNAIA